jgi:oligoribonuclease NrnB/cAMP/cGMP phosphodiesterase (DHH superfamily)
MSVICLHHNDADGRASAAVVRRALGASVVLHEMDYGDPVPWEAVEAAGQVIVVDFSLPADQMERLAENRQLVWIDHHKTSLEELTPIAGDWPGIRDINEAACVLTWQHFFPGQPVPRPLVLIGDRDIWRWAEADTGAFGEGLFHQDTRPDNDDLWKPLLDGDEDAVNRLVEYGGLLREAKLQEIRRKVSRYGHAVTFEGHKTLVINDRGNGDMGQYVRELGYQIAYCYIDNMQNGVLTTFVTLYSREVDVSEIARKFGGGGHPGAAGFSFPRRKHPFPSNSRVAW